MFLNWRRDDPQKQKYPSYDDQNHPVFEDILRKFCGFLDERQLGSFRATQCEVTYINRIPVDPDCRSPAEMIPRCFPGLSLEASDKFLPFSPEIGEINVSYRMPDNQGRLHASIRTAVLIKDNLECLDFRLTARGAPAGPEIQAVLEWLELGHSWVVNGFKIQVAYTARNARALGTENMNDASMADREIRPTDGTRANIDRSLSMGSFVPRQFPQKTPWKDSATNQLNALRSIPENWDGYGAAAPNPEIIDSAAGFLDYLSQYVLVPAPTIQPTRNGGILLEWESGPHQLEVDICARDAASYVYLNTHTDDGISGSLFRDSADDGRFLEIVRSWFSTE